MIIAALLALVGSGCGVFGSDTITLTADFEDVIDLVAQAHVRAGDVPIGSVTKIELTDDQQARVTLEVETGTDLPSDTRAVLKKTSMLGERYVELIPNTEGGTLVDGQHLGDSAVVGELEALVATGNELLGFIATDRLAAAVETGAVAFGGRGGILGRFLDDINAFVGNIEEGKDDIVALIDALDAYLGGVVDSAEINAEALAVLERSTRALAEEDDRLIDALNDLERLSVVGDRIMTGHRTEIDDLVRRIRRILNEVARIDGSLQGLLTWLPRHNLHVPNATLNGFAQVWLDFIICGFSDTEDDPSRDCTPPNPGESNEHPGFSPNPEGCNEDHAECPGRQQVTDDGAGER
ncbi:MAG: MCE family protein [Actinobacteria bacterium]|nr:MCE family protein [Actinomycetota bacterium]